MNIRNKNHLVLQFGAMSSVPSSCFDAVFYQQKETHGDDGIGFRRPRFSLIQEQHLL